MRWSGRCCALSIQKRDTLVLTSDHGNLEDYPLHGHSRNPVPLIAWGRHGDFLRGKIKSLSDVTPAIIELDKCVTSDE